MKILKFYRDYDNRWYVFLPEWLGEKADLEMVSGADTMLDIISQGETEIRVAFSLSPFDDSNKLTMIRLATELDNGAYYLLDHYNGIDLNLELWLCDVTKFVFGDLPELIYFR